MALSADYIYETANPEIQAVPAVNGDVLYAGALIGIDSAGYAAPWDDVTNYNFVGVCMRQVTGDTSASPVPEAEINTSGVILKKATIGNASSQTDVGILCYATDDNTFTLSSTSNVNAVGRVSRWYSSTTCDIDLFTPAEYMALQF
jgi:hypothetical protein